MKESFESFIENVQLLLKILRWKEYWTTVAVSLSIFGIWLIFWLSMYLPSPWNTVLMWGVIIGLALVSPRDKD